MVLLSQLVAPILEREWSAEPLPRRNWRSVHLHTEGDGNSVLPLIEDVMLWGIDAGYLEGFFFVRYAEGGRHIRVRFHGPSDRASHIENVLVDLQVGEKSPITYAKPQPYVPETDRYGGPNYLPVFESQFMVSSIAALSLHADARLSGASVYNRLLQGSAECMLAGVRTIFRDPAAGAAFLAAYHKGWAIPRLEAASPEQHRSRLMERRTAMINHYHQTAPTTFTAAVRQRWSVDTAPLNEHDPLSFWTYWTSRLFRLVRDRGFLWSSAKGRDVLASLLHMNNNRLGIGNLDESYVACVLASGLEDLDP